MKEKGYEGKSSTETEATWTSVYAAPCWISLVYYSTTLEGDDDTNKKDGDDENGIKDGNCKTQEETEEIRKENNEVLGWTLDSAARGVAVMGTAVFVSSDLLRLAKEAAGCVVYEETWEEECIERIYGMRPSSILTNIIVLVGLLSAVIMPLIGSIIDHTQYRRAVGSLSAAFMCLTILLQMLVMENFWLVAAMLQIVVAFSYTVHLCAVYAYLPELTSNHEKLTQYATRFSAAQYSGSVAFLFLMVGILSTVNRNNRFRSSLLSQTLVFVICSICFGYAWVSLFQPRSASQKVPDNKSLVSAGFWKIYKTAQTILLHHSAIKWLLVSAAFTQAATTTFSTIAITYMTEQLSFNPRENGIAILILLLFAVPGTRIAAWLTKSFNPVVSLQANLIFWICSIFLASFFLYKPGQQVIAYVCAMVWGLAIGWVYPTEKALYVTIIPRGQEAELMGTYICACQMLSWLPPLVFTVMNEMGFSMRIGLLTLSIYFFISFLVLFCVGNYEEAVSHAKAIDEGRIPFTVGPKEDLGAAIGVCYEQFTEESICQPIYLLSDSDVSVKAEIASTNSSGS